MTDVIKPKIGKPIYGGAAGSVGFLCKKFDYISDIWSDPTTREKLLHDLSEAGYDNEKLESMKDLIDGKESDVYDVLAFVAYAAATRTRTERVAQAKPSIKRHSLIQTRKILLISSSVNMLQRRYFSRKE